MLGDALHAILAAEFQHPSHPDRVALAGRILANHEISTAVAAEPAAAMALRFREWIFREFQPKSVLVECPFHYHDADGQLMTGFVDLLLETEQGWVVIDHKSFQGARSRWEEKALSYAGQIAAYGAALQASGRVCATTWIHFGVGGGILLVQSQ